MTGAGGRNGGGADAGVGAGGADPSGGSGGTGGAASAGGANATGGTTGSGGTRVDAGATPGHAVDALYVMLDQSGSMLDKWGAVSPAIVDFASAPASAGLSVGIGYFPLALSGCIPVPTSDCAGADFAQPEVPLAPLDTAHAEAVAANVGQHAPCGAGTPMEPALRGVIAGCIAYQSGHPGARCAGVLITDGAPTSCALTEPELASVITEAIGDTGVRLYLIGLAVSGFTLEPLAVAGGTDCDPASSARACSLGPDPNAVMEVLERIRDEAP